MPGRGKKKPPQFRRRDVEPGAVPLNDTPAARPVTVAVLFETAAVSLESIEPALARQTILRKRTRAAPSERTGNLTNSFAVEVDGVTVAGMVIPAPYPVSELTFPIATAWNWPSEIDASVSRSGEAHVLVVMTGGEHSPVENHLIATAVAALVAELPGAISVYWPAGRVVHHPARFVTMAGELRVPENPPLYLWANFGVEPGDEGTSTLFTAGMEALDIMDIEMHGIRGAPMALRQRANSLFLYQLEHRTALQPGDTIEGDGDGQLRVSHGQSSFGLFRTVVRLEPMT